MDYKKDLLKNGVISFVPGGNSMWPILKHRKQSVIIIAKKERLKKHDVAFYQRQNGTIVLHRVMEVIDDGYVMCGDSQLSLEKVKEDAVFGVMTSFYRGKRCVEVTDGDYIKEVERWYGNENRRKRKLQSFYFRQRVKGKIARAIRRIKNVFNRTSEKK